MNRLLILCPGQGDQGADMFDLPRSALAAAAWLDSLALPAPHAGETIFANRVAQPAIVAATLAMWQAIRTFAPTPSLVAGYSIGELSAYGVAGALTATDAVQLATTRARLMDDCLRQLPGQALAAVSGLPLLRIAELVSRDRFQIAIETGADSCIAGGPAAGLASLEHALAAAGARVKPLPVEIASHTRYMESAVAPFAAALRAAEFHVQSAPVMSGIAATRISAKAGAVEQLSRQLAEKIVWMDCMDGCAEAGITVALELGPGSALSRMLQTRHPQIACRSVADFRTLGGIEKWLGRHFD